MPIKTRLPKHNLAALAPLELRYSVEWVESSCCFLVKALNYSEHVRLKLEFSTWFSILETFGHPLGDGAYVIHGVFWRYVRNLSSISGCRLCGESGLVQFNQWLKDQETTQPLPIVISGLRPYQVEGAYRLTKGSLILGDDMGIGKTVQMLEALMQLKRQALVVIPNDSIADEWTAQIEKFNLPLTSAVVHRKNKEAPDDADLLFVTYAKVRRAEYLKQLLHTIKDKVLILDEGHRAGRISSQQHQACYQLAEQAERIWVSSGTEVSGTPDDYYGVFRLVVPCHYGGRLLITPESWVSYFRCRGTKAWAEVRLKEDLHTVRRGFGIRRTKAEVCKELPPLTEVNHALPMHPIQLDQYLSMKRDLQAKVLSQYGEQELTENQFIVAYLRLLQLAAHPMLVGETRIDLTPKSERLLQLVEDSGEQSVIVWSNWPDIIDWLAAAIQSKGISCLPVHGGTSKEKRIQAKDSFMAGETRVLVANPGVWGEGVNLQKASIMIDHDYHPSLSRWKQSRARAHRMGQTLPVTNYRLFHSSSIEVQVLDWLEEKVRLSTIITGDNKK